MTAALFSSPISAGPMESEYHHFALPTCGECDASKPSPPPSVADSACSVCTTRHFHCDGKKPQCSNCIPTGSEAMPDQDFDRDSSTGEILLPAALEPHRDFIDGVRRIYQLLVDMRYIPESELQWPPHERLRSTLAPLGYDFRVIQILAYLPFLVNTVVQRSSPELDHGTYGINYLDKEEAEDVRDVCRPEELFLFKSSSDFGNYYVYNMNDQSMKLATAFQIYNNEQGRQEFDRLKPRPAAQVLGDLVKSYQMLTLIPMRGRHGFQLSSSMPGSDTEIKRLYARYGWPNQFDGDGFEKGLAAWLERESQRDGEAIARMTRTSAVEAQTGAPSSKTMRTTKSLRERLHLMHPLSRHK